MRQTIAMLAVLAHGHLAWGADSYTTLHSFDGKDGATSVAGLVSDASGALYGTTNFGGPGGYGTVFKLVPPAPGQSRWMLQTIHAFTGHDGAFPGGVLLIDKQGALYGTTPNGDPNTLFGTVFKLSPPHDGFGDWQFQTLWAFNGRGQGGASLSGLIMDEQGALYGTTDIGGGGFQGNGSGTVFKLAPAGQSWTFQTLCFFGRARRAGAVPNDTLYRDAQGVLYGTDAIGGVNGFGTAFTLTPPVLGQTKWTRREIVEFTFPDVTPFNGLVPGPGGALYGVSTGVALGTAGTVFRLVPPAAGQTRWRKETVFQFNGLDGAVPYGLLTSDRHGGFYGSTYVAGSKGGGTLFHLLPPPAGSHAWSLQTLHDYDSSPIPPNVYEPNGGLVLDAAGALYGTTVFGGPTESGTIFRYGP